MKDLSAVARKLKERSLAHREFELLPADFNEQGLGPFAPTRLPYSEFQRAMQLKQLLLQDFAGANLEDIYEGRAESNEYGSFFHILQRAPSRVYVYNKESAQQAIISDLKLLYGIGPIIESRLKREGYNTIADLASHPRWGEEANRFLSLLQDNDVKGLQKQIQRWLPISHPLTLQLTGMIKKESLVFFDLESMGLFNRPIVLLGLARPSEDGFNINIHQYLIRSITEELSALTEFVKSLSESEDTALVTYNGKAFDVNYVEERLSYYGLYEEIKLPHFDLLHYARRTWKAYLPDFRLETLERSLLGLQRDIDIPSILVPDFYNTYLETGNIGALIPIIEHNKQDLITLSLLLSRLCSSWR